jgi:hypothetical protein
MDMDRRQFLKLAGTAVVSPTSLMCAAEPKPAAWYLVFSDGREVGPPAIIDAVDLPSSYHEKLEATDADMRIDWIQITGPLDNPLPPETQVVGRLTWPDGRVARITRLS